MIPQFSKYLFRSHFMRTEIAKTASGVTRFNISKARFKKIQIPIPPLKVQEEIVRILDTFTELTAELTAELIARKMQYTYYRDRLLTFEMGEVEWKTLGELAENLDSMRKPIASGLRAVGDIPYYGASGIVDYVKDYIFEGDFLLVSEDGANLLARNTPIAFSASGKIWVNNHAHVLKFKTYEERRFVEFYINHINLTPYISGAAQPKLNQKNLNSIIVPNPKWVQSFDNFEELNINLDELLSHVRFGVKADRFELALDELSKVLGFPSERPDKEWKAGPDNLWKVKDNEYLLIECKSGVDLTRNEINKDETGQMNNACAWFTKNYGDVPVKRIMIIPSKKVNNSTGFNYPVEIVRDGNLRKLNNNVKAFFTEFKQMDLSDLSDTKIQELLVLHKLTADDIINLYSENPRT
ncbi:restriction modification system DNA specificity protein [Paenibacillus algicola]|uniref:Restriction modification system DNA specificity protein n=1 Tax=Paenibacillus algicola TaxID=2565926 RepID=A0A4P8XG10_9BACL|nr:restriction endonuclease subunit S [Paenibacillus algicola]QCT01397.1 restriction modification system DNA specificity protein [Paenibacillus algicola]